MSTSVSEERVDLSRIIPSGQKAQRISADMPAETRSGSPDSDALLASPTARDLVARACTAIGEVYTTNPESTEKWLSAAGRALHQFIDSFHHAGSNGRLVGAWLAMVSQTTLSGEPVIEVGSSGYSTEQAAQIVRRAAAAWCSRSRLAQGLMNTQVGSGDGPQLPGGISCAQRTILPLRWAGSVRWLVLELNVATGSPGPGKSGVAAAELMLPLIAGVLEQTVGRLEAHRHRLAMRVSPAQQPILPMLATGMSQRLIAERVQRSLHTVHDHVKSIYGSLGVNSRFQFQRLWNGHEPGDFQPGDDAE
ncbi:MAG: helix-turn-helix transcriptional regulator [Phycisphaerales bacterium]